MAKVFITGSAGFIASHLWDYLRERGHSVEGIDNFSHACRHPENHRVSYGDIRYYQDVEKYIKWADIVIHCAAQIHVDKSITNPQETIDVNVSGTLNILEAVRKYDKRLVFASSSEVYGTSQTEAMDELHPLDGQSPYAASKTAGDRLCKAYFDTYGTKITVLRNFNTFGKYQNDTSYGGVIAIFTRRALNNEDIVVFGDGTQSRDYMDIKDALRGYELCMSEDNLIGETINVGTGKTITINEVAEIIKKLTKSKSKIVHANSRPGEVMRLCADITRAKENGFEPQTDFEKDINDYVQWYQSSNRSR